MKSESTPIDDLETEFQEFNLINPYVRDEGSDHPDRDFEPRDPGWYYTDRDPNREIDAKYAENPLNY